MIATFIGWFWQYSWIRKTAIYAALALAFLALIAVVWFKGKGAAKTEILIDSLQNTLEAERRIKDAQASGARDRGDVRRKLRDGTF
jgi:hypothetical protein